jgi:Flp pilus assembly protein TadD
LPSRALGARRRAARSEPRRAVLPLLLGSILAALAAGCAPPPRAPQAETADYVFPSLRPGEAPPGLVAKLDRAWRSVLSGDVADAEKRYRALLGERPGLPAAEAGLAYARLRRGDSAGALAAFEAVLKQAPGYTPALHGAGGAQIRAGDPEGAFATYRRLLEASPDDGLAKGRLGELKLQVTERRVGAARAALQAGERERAITEYRRALEVAPEVPDLRLELANLLVEAGQVAEAVRVLEAGRAEERALRLRLGEQLVRAGEPGRAVDVYKALAARDPRDAAVRKGLAEAERAAELLRQPQEYRRIPAATRITRADLAALLVIRVPALARVPASRSTVATDVSGSWARAHILKVLSQGLMDVYPNHTFQPAATVRRGDLAAAVGRALEALRVPSRPGPVPRDLGPSNLLYVPVTRVLAAGLMDVSPKGDFEAWRQVSGKDAIAVVDQLARLAGA